jgi:Legionella pneumophila major outer membrane protein precursor
MRKRPRLNGQSSVKGIMNIFKIYVLGIFVSFICFASFAQADEIVSQDEQNTALLFSRPPPSKSRMEREKDLSCDTFLANCIDCTQCCKTFHIGAELLYFKAVEDSLVYSNRLPQSGTGTVTSYAIEQTWKYNPCGRISFVFPIFFDDWSMGTSWTYVKNHPQQTNAYSSIFDLYASMIPPSLTSNGNSYINKVSGQWNLLMNVFDLVLERSFMLSKGFKFTPLFGVEGAVVRQTTHVVYSDFDVVSTSANTPQDIKGKNKMWGVGPELGINFALIMPKNFTISVLSSFTSLFGQAYMKTVYSQLLGLTADDTVSFVSRKTRLFSKVQVRAAAEKMWCWCDMSLSLSAGWETQVWFRQLRLDYFSTMGHPPSGSDLTLQGPFARLCLSF